jgi:hypothetical protein
MRQTGAVDVDLILQRCIDAGSQIFRRSDWIRKFGHILKPLALSCSNVLVAGFAPHDVRHNT